MFFNNVLQLSYKGLVHLLLDLFLGSLCLFIVSGVFSFIASLIAYLWHIGVQLVLYMTFVSKNFA